MGVEGWHGEDPTYGDNELKEAWDSTTFRTGNVKMGNGEYATTLDMLEIWDGLQKPDCNDSGSTSVAKFLNRAGGHSNSRDMLSGLQNQLLPNDAKGNFWFAN